MNLAIRKRFASKIGIVAGYQSADYKGAQLIQHFKKINPDAQFFGLAGEKMTQADPTFKNHGRLKNFTDKSFYPHYNFDLDPRSPIYVPLICSHLQTTKMLHEFKRTGFYDNFEYGNTKDIDMILTIHNPTFAYRLHEKITKVCESHSETKPIVVHFDVMKRNLRYEHTNNLDFCVHTLPLLSADVARSEFPSQFVGKKVVFDALSFLYKQNPKFAEYVTDSTIDICPQMNILIVEELAFELRKQFREKHFINDSVYLFFISPGSEEKEIDANIKVAADAIDVFIKKFSEDNRFTKKNFGVVLSLPEDKPHLKSLASQFDSLGLYTQTIIGNKNGERYAAMAGCDLAAVANGDSVFESSVFQLPTVILDNSPFFGAYFKLMYNVQGSEFNWNYVGELLPETLGRNFGSKVSEFWENWFITPKSRYRLARKANKHLLDLLPEQPSSPNAPAKLFDEAKDYKTFLNPDLVLHNFLQKVYSEFRDVKQKGHSRHEKEHKRRVIVFGPEFA